VGRWGFLSQRKNQDKSGSWKNRRGDSMEQFTVITAKISKIMDSIAGWCMASIMVLVISNILLRILIKRPILGTYEYVGFFTALVIGFALAHCAVQNSHIAINLVTDRLPVKVQTFVKIFIDTIAFIFLALSSWHLVLYGKSMAGSGEVSLTTRLPFYPFIYLIAFGISILALVVLADLINCFGKGVKK
jgi:TRAP-type C4-dicarboxylate transport system permease small subunit